MSDVANRLEALRRELPAGVELVAVSKFKPADMVTEAYDAGQRIFGESRAAELAEKAATLPADIRWHFIGHVQTNKLRQIVGAASMIESVDSERLLRKIDEEARRQGRTIDVLLEVHVASEETKTGFSPDELRALDVDGLTNTRIRGVMGMATNTDDAVRIAADFDAIASMTAVDALKGVENPIVSMGMTADWPIAVAHGSTMVRIGSAIFGERTYN